MTRNCNLAQANMLLLVFVYFVSGAYAVRGDGGLQDGGAAGRQLQQLVNDHKPGFIKGVHFSPLDVPPAHSSGKDRDWSGWVNDNTATIIKEAPRSRYVVPKPDNDDHGHERPNMFGKRVDVIHMDDEKDLVHALTTPGHVANIIYVHELDDFKPQLKALENAIQREVVDSDFYIAQPNAGSYGWHFDSVDNLVYCVNGTKRFRVAGTQVGSPVVVDIVMEPGDAIFVPTGYYHIGVGGTEDRSMIWSIGMDNDYWEDTYGENYLERKGDFDEEWVEDMMEQNGKVLTWEEIGSRTALHHEL